ncbi:MAG: ornithine cyclodeaminase family protein [Candidatus Omnitrophica bacterium]|nr:ornithine cyclodeaminase family protein [Candidatus Omnitrophota bacterium]
MRRLSTLVLTQREVARVLDLRLAIRVVREALRQQALGRTTMPPKLYLPLPRQGDFRAMPAALQHPAACGVKWVNVHPGNPARGLPTVMAVIILNDPATGAPVAILDGGLITKIRTAASAAVAAQILARRGAGRVALVGCGAQADAQLLALACVRRLREVRVWGYWPGEAERFCRRMRPQLRGARLAAAGTVRECVRQAELIVTMTIARRPLVQRGWVAEGAHLNAIGADAPGKQELDPRLLHEALVVVDDRAQALHAGELNVPVSRGQFRARDIHATLGEVLLGCRRGRRSARELTVFDSTGLAIHDVALAHAVVARAARAGLGKRLSLV